MPTPSFILSIQNKIPVSMIFIETGFSFSTSAMQVRAIVRP